MWSMVVQQQFGTANQRTMCIHSMDPVLAQRTLQIFVHLLTHPELPVANDTGYRTYFPNQHVPQSH